MSLLSGERRSNRMDIVSRVFPAFRLPGKDLLSVCGWHLRSDTLARMRTRKLVLFTAIVCGLLQTGCSTMGCCLTARVEHESQVEYIVIGFGVIRVAKPDIATAVRASRASILTYCALWFALVTIPPAKTVELNTHKINRVNSFCFIVPILG